MLSITKESEFITPSLQDCRELITCELMYTWCIEEGSLFFFFFREERICHVQQVRSGFIILDGSRDCFLSTESCHKCIKNLVIIPFFNEREDYSPIRSRGFYGVSSVAEVLMYMPSVATKKRKSATFCLWKQHWNNKQTHGGLCPRKATGGRGWADALPSDWSGRLTSHPAHFPWLEVAEPWLFFCYSV